MNDIHSRRRRCEAIKVAHIEGQNPRDIVGMTDSDESRIMHLFSDYLGSSKDILKTHINGRRLWDNDKA